MSQMARVCYIVMYISWIHLSLNYLDMRFSLGVIFVFIKIVFCKKFVRDKNWQPAKWSSKCKLLFCM
jgi:multisubunit Na+/H+ antiporter MnhE subunit